MQRMDIEETIICCEVSKCVVALCYNIRYATAQMGLEFFPNKSTMCNFTVTATNATVTGQVWAQFMYG
jgi:hypothetical protein